MRVASSSAGLGPSSTIFWCRRCTEQSRSPTWTPVPKRSTMTWTSTWRVSSSQRLEVERVVAERGARLGAADRERLLQLARRPHEAHALAAATGRGLDEHRVADALRLRRARARRRASIPSEPGTVGSPWRPSSSRVPALDAKRSRTSGRRADEREVVGAGHLGEAVVLGEEAVARMDRVAAADERRRDDARPPTGRSATTRPGRCRSPRRP